MRIKTKSDSGNRPCLVCGGSLGFFRRMAESAFCSDDHERTYLDELGQIALMRLQRAALRIEALRYRRANA